MAEPGTLGMTPLYLRASGRGEGLDDMILYGCGLEAKELLCGEACCLGPPCLFPAGPPGSLGAGVLPFLVPKLQQQPGVPVFRFQTIPVKSRSVVATFVCKCVCVQWHLAGGFVGNGYVGSKQFGKVREWKVGCTTVMNGGLAKGGGEEAEGCFIPSLQRY